MFIYLVSISLFAIKPDKRTYANPYRTLYLTKQVGSQAVYIRYKSLKLR